MDRKTPEEVVLIITLSDQPFTTGDLVYGQIMNIPEIFQYDSSIDYTTYYEAPLKKVVSKRVDSSLRLEVERLKKDNKIMRSGFDALHGENEKLRKEGLEFPSEPGEQINWFLVNAMRILNSEQRLSLADNILERSEVETRDKLQEKFNELNTRHQNVRDVVRISKKEKDALQSLNTELVSALRLLHSMRFDQPYYTKEQSDTFRRVTAALSRAEGKTT